MFSTRLHWTIVFYDFTSNFCWRSALVRPCGCTVMKVYERWVGQVGGPMWRSLECGYHSQNHNLAILHHILTWSQYTCFMMLSSNNVIYVGIEQAHNDNIDNDGTFSIRECCQFLFILVFFSPWLWSPSHLVLSKIPHCAWFRSKLWKDWIANRKIKWFPLWFWV